MNYLTNLDLNKNEIQNAVIQPLAVAPSNPKEGQIYYNSSDKFIYRYNGTAWGPIGVVYQQGSTTGAVITGLDNTGKVTTTNVVGLTLTGYTPVEDGYVSNGMTLQQAIAALDTAVKNAVAGGGEVNQNAWSNITVPTQSTNVTSEVAGESSAVTIAANAKTDTFTIASGDAWTKVDADASHKKITLGHKFSGVTNGTYGDATHVAKVSVDKAGHVTGAESVEIVGGKYITGLTSDAQTQLNTKVPNTRTVNGKALSNDITLSAGDVGADPSGSASAVLGTSSDTSDKNTVYGVKALAQSALDTANAAKTSADGKVASVNAGNNGISVSGTTTAPTVGLKISGDTGNLAKITTDGLKVVAPEYSITKDATAQSGFLATYHLTKGGVEVGTAINIPKDYLVKSAEVKVATGSDASGFPAGTTYIDFVVNTYDTTSGSGTESHIYLNVETLVKTHTAGNGISISDTNVISAKVVAANGLSVDSNGIKMGVASTSANGAMTSSMVTKLNGIDTGATANTITLNGSATKTPSFYAPTGAGTSGQILVSSGSGAPTWKNAPESFHKYTATNGALTASGGAFTWSIPATTHKVSNAGIIVQLYQVSTGEMVFADVTVNQSNYNVTITINDTSSAGTLASGTYRVVIFG